ncbi:MAG: ABC transporter permease subunit [Proteobacteria bacterium]|nr:ABC transporter permease subunit [Pseudomonadota bacterium]
MPLIQRSVLEKSKSSVIYLVLFVGLIFLLVGIYKGGVHLSELKAETVYLPDLPGAIFLSLMRMAAAYCASLVFAFIFGLLAARTATGERFILPVLDILQSVPVVGFFPAAITFFIGLTHGHRIGVELSAVFLIFTSQAWNIGFAVYESVKAIPVENEEAIMSLGLPQSQRFLNLYLPSSIPRVIYNSILSWSNGWFFLVACEIIAIGPVKYNLPGIGSFLARAAEEEKLNLVLWGIAALACTILTMDIFIWKPLQIWSERFRQDATANQDEEDIGIFLELPKTIASRLSFLTEPLIDILITFTAPVRWILREVVLPLCWDLPVSMLSNLFEEVAKPIRPVLQNSKRMRVAIGYFALGFLAVLGIFYIWNWFQGPLPAVIRDIPVGLFRSTLRILIALFISFAWVLPLVYFTWNRPKIRHHLTTLAQLGASIPATALFPLIVLVGVRKLGGGMELATLVLLTFGIQWYVLFNAIGGASSIPNDLIDATKSYGLNQWKTFWNLVFPAIRPALITGAITAWGGGWNALVVSEYITVKSEVYRVEGLGALLSYAVYDLGEGRAITLCILVMVAWILFVNLLIWQPLYQQNLERFKFSS